MGVLGRGLCCTKDFVVGLLILIYRLANTGKKHPELNERWMQDRIAEDPSILALDIRSYTTYIYQVLCWEI